MGGWVGGWVVGRGTNVLCEASVCFWEVIASFRGLSWLLMWVGGWVGERNKRTV